MKTKIEFEKYDDLLIVREGDRQRNFQVLQVIRYGESDEINLTEWELHEHNLPILQHVYQRFCEKNCLQVTREGYAAFREHALYLGFRFEEN